MSRHSKHNNDRAYYSYQERKDAGFAGTRKEVLGTDCFLPFGYCALSLKPPKDPVATPEGWIYDRGAILESLLQQKVELQAQQKKFEEQERKKARKVTNEKQEAEMQALREFQQADQGLLSQDVRHKKRSIQDSVAYGAPDGKKLREGEMMVLDKAELRNNVFWIKENTQTAAPAELQKVDTTAKCPMSNKKLRVKDLVSIKLEVTDQKMIDRGGDKGVFCCAVSKHPITHQQAVVLKPSGIVILESVLKDCVYKDMKCPITDVKIDGKKDVMKLQMGGTGFSAHNETQAKSFSHIRSFTGDARLQSGHLPKGGFVGLH